MTLWRRLVEAWKRRPRRPPRPPEPPPPKWKNSLPFLQ